MEGQVTTNDLPAGGARHGRRGRGQPVPSRRLKDRASEVLPEIDDRLQRAFHTASLGNKEEPLDELIYIQLSIRTREGTYSDIYSSLRDRVGGRWENLLSLPAEEIVGTLRSGGMAEVKLARLRAQIERIRDTFGRVTLDPLRELSDDDAEAFLTGLPGVGPKAARCILLYSLRRDVFPVDSHCRRVLGRLAFLPPGVDRKQADDFLQDLVPASMRHTLHVNLVHHGRSICLPVTPRCGQCTLLDLCPTGQKFAQEHPVRSGPTS